jgi:Cu-Zn family superoxide dismutase
MIRLLLISTFILAQAAAAYGETLRTTVNSITASGIGPAIGTVTFEDTKWGLLVTPDLSGLPPGVHGFHIHEKPSCKPAEHEGKLAAGFAAGGHYDPQHTGKHLGPYDIAGHEGDLPPLVVDADGKATLSVLAPRLTVKDVRGHSIMIHAGADNYSDRPAPLGGGGARIACGANPVGAQSN